MTNLRLFKDALFRTIFVLTSKLCERINCRTNRFLSYAGHLQMIKAVLHGIMRYSNHIFLSKFMLKNIQSLLSEFFGEDRIPVLVIIM